MDDFSKLDVANHEVIFKARRKQSKPATWWLQIYSSTTKDLVVDNWKLSKDEIPFPYHEHEPPPVLSQLTYERLIWVQ
jgi:hypothetical protein